MRDLGITVLVALLIVFAGVKFSGYQKQLAATGGTAAVVDVNNTLTASSTPATDGGAVTPPTSVTSATASLQVADQKAGNTVVLQSVVVPAGSSYWVAVRETVGATSRTLGARLFTQGTVTNSVVELLRPTVAGHTYSVVLVKDNGDGKYDRATDTDLKDSAGVTVSVSIKAL